MTPILPQLSVKLPVLPQRFVHFLFPVVVAAGAIGWAPGVLTENGVTLPAWAWLTVTVSVAKVFYLVGAACGIISQGARQTVTLPVPADAAAPFVTPAPAATPAVVPAPPGSIIK